MAGQPAAVLRRYAKNCAGTVDLDMDALRQALVEKHVDPAMYLPEPAETSLADARPADASPADATPADATPADASPPEASPGLKRSSRHITNGEIK